MAIRIKKLSISNTQGYSEILRRAKLSLQDTIDKVKPIIESVEKNGDEALLRFTSQFDGVDLKNFVIDPNQKQIVLSLLKQPIKISTLFIPPSSEKL